MSACAPKPPEPALRRLKEACAWLSRRGLRVANLLISRLGTPQFAPVGTARVREAGERLILEFDPDFWQELTTAELVGVLAHEAMHVLLCHLDGPWRDDPGLRYPWNLAADAVVNDRIMRAYPEVQLPKDCITGAALVGRNCAGLSAEQVLDMLLAQVAARPARAAELVAITTLDDHGGWGGDADLELDARVVGRVPLPGFSHRGGMSDTLRESVGALVAEAGDHDEAAACAWGDAALGRPRAVTKAASPLNPANILAQVLARIARWEPSWVPPNPKMMAVYPRLLLPRWDTHEKPRVLIALDASGSISTQWLSSFLAVARASARHAWIDLVSFDTVVYPLVEEGGLRVCGGGGTSFDAVEEYVVAKYERHPDAVIVLTDGCAARPHLSKPERWMWLIPEHGLDAAVQGLGRVIRLPVPRRRPLWFPAS